LNKTRKERIKKLTVTDKKQEKISDT
jgi:hypothetical protein